MSARWLLAIEPTYLGLINQLQSQCLSHYLPRPPPQMQFPFLPHLRSFPHHFSLRHRSRHLLAPILG